MIRSEATKDLQKLVKKNTELIIGLMENCQKILDNTEKYGDTAAYKASTLILCIDSLMNIIASPYKDKIEEAKYSLFLIHQTMILENKEHQISEHTNNPHFIFNTSKTLQ
jgi:hypothetical protein